MTTAPTAPTTDVDNPIRPAMKTNDTNNDLVIPGTVVTSKKIWRPKLPSLYIEPDFCPDLLDGQELIFQEHGKSLRHTTAPLSPRQDIVLFDPTRHQAEFDRNIRWHDCPQEYQPRITTLIKKYWDVFCEEGLRRNIRGFMCRVDTGAAKPICCRPPRYGPHEAKVMEKLIDKLYDNGLIEDDDGPWGALVVLAAKPHQEEIPWHEYIWRLCVSYRRLNQITRPYTFPIPRCDDAVTDIGPNMAHFISFDLDCGYWQVTLEESSRAKTAFFTPNGKVHWTVMPMGFINSHSTFVAMMSVMKKEWDAIAEKEGVKIKWLQRGDPTPLPIQQKYGSKVIVDDGLIYAEDTETLFRYFEIVLRVLMHHSATIKLKKCQWLLPTIEFVGVDVQARGNTPAKSKFAAFSQLPAPVTWTELRMVIGMFGFYQKWIERYEVRVSPYRRLQTFYPKPGQLTFEEEKEVFAGFWLPSHQELFESLKQELLASPLLARYDSTLRCYVKTDWSKLGMGAVLLQPDSKDRAAIDAMLTEDEGGPCFFDLQRSGLRLRPIEFLSRRTTLAEQSYHSYVGELCAARWAFQKFRKYLFGKIFTWLTDCSGAIKFLETLNLPTHLVQRIRAELLLYQFEAEHRPDFMLTECDMLSRYNQATKAWRDRTQVQAETEDQQAIVAMCQAVQKQVVNDPKESNPNEAGKSDSRDLSDQLQDGGIELMTSILFHSRALESNPSPRQYVTLPESEYRGNPSWPTVSAFTRATSKKRAIAFWGPEATPLFEAAEQASIDTEIFRLVDDEETQTSEQASQFPSTSMSSFFETVYEGTCPAIDWFVAVYPNATTTMGVKDVILDEWIKTTIKCSINLADYCHLNAACLILPTAFPSTLTAARKLLPNTHSDWSIQRTCVSGPAHGAAIEHVHDILLLLPKSIASLFSLPTMSALPSPMGEVIDIHGVAPTTALHMNEFHLVNPTMVARATHETPDSARVKYFINLKSAVTPIDGWPVFDTTAPAPSIMKTRAEEKFFDAPFAVQQYSWCRTIQLHELVKLYGIGERQASKLQKALHGTKILAQLRAIPTVAALAIIFQQLRHTDTTVALGNSSQTVQEITRDPPQLSSETTASPAIPNEELPNPEPVPDNLSILPLPSDADWRQATLQDHDLGRIVQAATYNTVPEDHELVDKGYLEPLKNNQIEVENDIVFRYEASKAARVQQIRVRVAPISLRRTLLAACHSSPFGGHSSIQRTLYRIQVRYWWPGLARDARQGIRGCAHCNLSNIVSHEAQSLLSTLSCDGPFDVIFLDLWSPGHMTDKQGNTKILTFLDCMTGFASAAFLQFTITSETIADAAVSQFFVHKGMPRLIIFDADSLFQGHFKRLFELLQIPAMSVSRENHKAVRNERFHRYLNKVERINTANTGSMLRWKQGVLFALYAWNAGPIDGTDLPRCVAAIGREFPFPLDLCETTLPRHALAEGQDALDYFEAASPLLFKQRELLLICNEERRRRHREIRNEGIKQRTFELGDLVIVRKQVKSDASKGVAAKLLFRARGPYRVIEKITPSSYKVQKLPFLRGLGRPGRFRKENVARMTKIPTTLVLHKLADGLDTRFLKLSGALADMPLAKWLGVRKPGAYQQAEPDVDWAFEPLASMWSDQDLLDADDDDEDNDDPEFDPDNPKGSDYNAMDIESDPEDEEDVLNKFEDNDRLPKQRKFLPIPPFAVNDSSKRYLQAFYNRICDSNGKLFLIAYNDNPTMPATPTNNSNHSSPTQFRLGQVIWKDLNPVQARTSGVYPIQWYVQQVDDAKKRSITDSRFWPYTRVVKADGELGKPHSCRPDRVEEFLINNKTIRWDSNDIQLADSAIVGPFDFTQKRLGLRGAKRLAMSEPYHIDDIYWQQLETRAPLFNVSTEHIRRAPVDKRAT